MNAQTAPATPPVKDPRRAGPVFPPEFQAAKIMQMDSAQCVAIVKDAASTEFQKAKACMRLATVGNKEAVPALATLLSDEHLSHYARFALAPIPDASVDDTLRGALKTVKGALLMGVVDSIGQRKDIAAVPLLARMLHGADIQLAETAAAALGRIGGPEATAALNTGLTKTKGPVRNAIAAASLVAAEGLLAQGDRKGALTLYSTLSRTDLPKSVRLAAMHSTIAAETSLTRPRVAPAKLNR
jgi:HEAT repeat protein